MKNQHLLLLGLGICAANPAIAQPVDWVRTDSHASLLDSSGQPVNPGITNASSGSFDLTQNGTAEQLFGYSSNISHIAAADISNRLYADPGGFISVVYSFSETIVDAEFSMSGGWQYNDYAIEILGGGTIDTSAITFRDPALGDGVAGSDFSITGDGTSNASLDGISFGDRQDIGYGFRGQFTVSGNTTGLRITQRHDPDRIVSLGGLSSSRVDPVAVARLSGGTIIPTPPSALMVSFGGIWLVRRRR